MSQEKVVKTLESLGLTRSDAEIYVLLGKRGPQRARDIVYSLKKPKHLLYPALKSLERKGILTATLERPARFSVVPFNKVLDLFVNEKMDEARRIQKSKTEILSDWESITVHEKMDDTAKFAVLEGDNCIYSRLKQMAAQTETQLLLITTAMGLNKADQLGLLDTIFDHISRSKARFRLLVGLTAKNSKMIKDVLNIGSRNSASFEGRTPDLGLKLPNPMIIRDEEEVAFVINSEDSRELHKTNTCLWTNCKALVQSFSAVFENSWRNSLNIKKRLVEIETGKQSPQTCLMDNPQVVCKTYEDAIRKAQREILLLTAPDSLTSLTKEIRVLKTTNKQVSVKIMTPVARENLAMAWELMAVSDVRHISNGYLETAVIDEQHLFQFETHDSALGEKLREPFEKTFYTNDCEYVKKAKRMLKDIWDASSPLPAITLRSGLNLRDKPVGPHPLLHPIKIDEGLTRIASIDEDSFGIPQRLMDAARASTGLHVGFRATAAVAPPSNLGIPDLYLNVQHYTKESEFGEGDVVEIFQWNNAAIGSQCVPVAVLHNGNEQAVSLTRKHWNGTLEANKIVRVKSEELQVWREGKAIFAGWTVPVPLLGSTENLPPSCIIFEEQGEFKPYTLTVQRPSGYLIGIEAESCDAFVTFLNPTWRFVGPGTSGEIYRKYVVIITQMEKKDHFSQVTEAMK